MDERLDPLGDLGRAKMAAAMLLNLYRERAQLELLQVANGAQDDEYVYGMAPRQEGETLIYETYGGRRTSLEAGIERLLERVEPIRELVERECERLRGGASG